MTDRNEMKQFLSDQIHEIEIHKWIESEKAHRDLGEEAVKDWIIHYAKQYREEWNKKHQQQNEEEN